MKPPPFKYYAPDTTEEALNHLAEYGYEAKALAGGQSLIPIMNFRLAQPEVLIDLNRIASLSYIHRDENGGLRLGAMTRHAQVEHHGLIKDHLPLIFEAMPQIATTQIRSRGTIGGSIAHADPSAELVASSVALQARFRLRSQTGERWVPADEFFMGMFTTLLEPDELLVEIEFPPSPSRTGWSLMEMSRRPHDFALVGVVAGLTLNTNIRCQDARIVFLSVGDGPVVAHQAGETLKDQELTPELIQNAAETAAFDDIDPSSDIHATADYRRQLAKVLTRRALDIAFTRAKNNSERAD
jgi:carbon-monoxide dehydrogenase medium subunit